MAINSKILAVTVRPLPKASEPIVVVELSHLINVSNSIHAFRRFISILLTIMQPDKHCFERIFGN